MLPGYLNIDLDQVFEEVSCLSLSLSPLIKTHIHVDQIVVVNGNYQYDLTKHLQYQS